MVLFLPAGQPVHALRGAGRDADGELADKSPIVVDLIA